MNPEIEIIYQLDDKRAIASYGGGYIFIEQKKKKPKAQVISPDAASFMIQSHKKALQEQQEKTANSKVLKAFQKALQEGKTVDDSKEWVKVLQHKLKNKQPIDPEHFKYNFPKQWNS